MQLPPFIKDHKEIIAAVTGGTLAIIAAYIRRDRHTEGKPARKKPIQRGLWLCVFSLFLGAACLAAEFYLFPVNADDPLDSDNVGELLCLAGCVFVAAGVIWGVVNLIRLMLWRKPVEVVPVPVPPAELTSQL